MIVRRLATWCIVLGIVLAGLPGVAAGTRETAPGEWEGVPRVIAVGDVHGTFDKIAAILIKSGLTDEELVWTGGQDHLVLVGDYLDRGDRERDVVELIRRLQFESADAGGRVHALLGNHELMNLIRDLRYVEPPGFAAFAEEERARERKRLRKRWIDAEVKAGNDREIATVNFDEKYPPGFLARSRAFERGEYAEWLLEQPVTVKINGVVFVHGGLNPEVAALGIDGINRAAPDGIREYWEQRGALEKRDLIRDLSYYAEHRAIAESILRAAETNVVDPVLRSAALGMRAFADSPIFGMEGPMWHRSYSRANERFERANLTSALASLGARAMVVGHTPTKRAGITQRFAGRLYRADVGMAYGGKPQALVFEGASVQVLDAESGEMRDPFVELPPGLEVARESIGEASLGALLESGNLMADRTCSGNETRGARLLHLRQDRNSVYAAFWGTDTLATHRRAAHELAASALDRILGWNLVPPTLVREIDGVAGALQHVDDHTIDGQSVEDYALELWDAEDLERQLARAQVFDALIGNCRRPLTEILYLPAERRVLLVDHSRAFAISLLAGCGEDAPVPEIEPELKSAISTLRREQLSAEIGQWLNEKQIDAILIRRDRLIEGPVPALD